MIFFPLDGTTVVPPRDSPRQQLTVTRRFFKEVIFLPLDGTVVPPRDSPRRVAAVRRRGAAAGSLVALESMRRAALLTRVVGSMRRAALLTRVVGSLLRRAALLLRRVTVVVGVVATRPPLLRRRAFRSLSARGALASASVDGYSSFLRGDLLTTR